MSVIDVARYVNVNINVMYEGNPGEIEFDSSQRGSSYWETTVSLNKSRFSLIVRVGGGGRVGGASSHTFS